MGEADAYVQVDYDKLGELAKLGTIGSTRTTYLSARKKVLDGKSLTPRDQEILSLSWRCFKSSPQVDFNKLKEKANLGTIASATTTFHTAKKKLLSSNTDKKDEAAPTPKKRKLSEITAEAVPEHKTTEPASEDDEEERSVRIKLEETEDEPVHPRLFENALQFLQNEAKAEAAPEEAGEVEEELFQ